MNKINKFVYFVAVLSIIILSGIYYVVCPLFYIEPEIFSISSNGDSVILEWNNIEGTDYYTILRNHVGEWDEIGITNTNKYIDYNVISGETYYYDIQYPNSLENITKNTRRENSFLYFENPDITTISAKDSISITWESIEKAVGYDIFRKDNESDWELLESVDSNTLNYIDSNVEYGRTYYYAVTCLNNKVSDKRVVSICMCDEPHLEYISVYSDGVYVRWNTIESAEKYRIFKKNDRGNWIGIATVDGNIAEFIDKNVESGRKYQYTIRCISSDEKIYTSAYDENGIMISYLNEPQLLSLEKENENVILSWNRVEGAEKYRIFEKINEGDWISIDTIDAELLTYVLGDLDKGNKYTFTVRCVDEKGEYYMSLFDQVGISIDY